MTDAPAFTPVNLLTGFLGSGKTTLLKRLLTDPTLADTAVLINEFGEIGLDHYLLERIDDTTVLLQSGCVCCTIRGELADALRALHSKREQGLVPRFTRVIIESTGLADPFPILSTIKADPVLRHHFRIGTMITTIDAINGAGQLDTYIESNRQAAIADRLIVTKTDLANEGVVEGLLQRLGRINPDATVLLSSDDLDANGLFDDSGVQDGKAMSSRSGFYCEPIAELRTADGGIHRAAVTSLVISVNDPIDWTGFGIWLTMLLNRHGERVLRVKGILNLEGETRPVAIHGVQHLVHPPVHMEAWPSGDRRSHIVFIVDGLDAALLRRSFEAFAVAARSPTLRRELS